MSVADEVMTLKEDPGDTIQRVLRMMEMGPVSPDGPMESTHGVLDEDDGMVGALEPPPPFPPANAISAEDPSESIEGGETSAMVSGDRDDDWVPPPPPPLPPPTSDSPSPPAKQGQSSRNRKVRMNLSKEQEKQIRSKLKAAAYTIEGTNLLKLFRFYDRDFSGSIEFKEFKHLLRSDAKIANATLSDAEVRKFFNSLDVDGSGAMSYFEFERWVNPSTPPPPPPPSPSRVTFDETATGRPSESEYKKKRRDTIKITNNLGLPPPPTSAPPPALRNHTMGPRLRKGPFEPDLAQRKKSKQRRGTAYLHTKSSKKKLAHQLAAQYEKTVEVKTHNDITKNADDGRKLKTVPHMAKMLALQAVQRERGTLLQTHQQLQVRVKRTARETHDIRDQTNKLEGQARHAEKTKARLRVALKRDYKNFSRRDEEIKKKVADLDQRLTDINADHIVAMGRIKQKKQGALENIQAELSDLESTIEELQTSQSKNPHDKSYDIAANDQLVQRQLAESLRLQRVTVERMLKQSNGSFELHASYRAAMHSFDEEHTKLAKVLSFVEEKKQSLVDNVAVQRKHRDHLLEALKTELEAAERLAASAYEGKKEDGGVAVGAKRGSVKLLVQRFNNIYGHGEKGQPKAGNRRKSVQDMVKKFNAQFDGPKGGTN